MSHVTLRKTFAKWHVLPGDDVTEATRMRAQIEARREAGFEERRRMYAEMFNPRLDPHNPADQEAMDWEVDSWDLPE